MLSASSASSSLASDDVFFYVGKQFLPQGELLRDTAVALKELDGVPAFTPPRDTAFEGLLDVRERVFHTAAKTVARFGVFLTFRRTDRRFRRVLHASAS